MRLYILIFCIVIIFQACSSPEKRVETSDSDQVSLSDTMPPETVSSSVAFTIFKGLYIFGDEVNTFRDCSNRKVYWVNDSIASLRKTYEQTNRFPAYPYESVYAEVKGYLSGKSKLGYASEYENVLVVTEILKVEPKNFRTDCYNYEFIALGNEPFWSLDIIPEERRIVLKEVGLEKAWEFIYAPAHTKDGLHIYEATNAARDKLVASIRMEKCSDGMSDKQYNYSAEITINGKILKGCAVKKGDTSPASE